MIMMDPKNFKAPYILEGKVREEADRVREKYWPSGKLPVEVEEILWGLHLKLDTQASLKGDSDIDAYLYGDLSRIVVDAGEYMDDRMQNRLRFSIAHELGHFVLHRKVYEKIHFSSFEEWQKFVSQIPDDQYRFIEWQAYEFAGRLLVPVERLRIEVKKAIQRSENSGLLKWGNSGSVALEYIASSICRVFGVSSLVVEKRLQREHLWEGMRM
jgi:hypothetical protein